jgi:uncharacterized phage protein (TIGR01671 family)
MGREIKFRAYDKETGEMSYDFLDKQWLNVAINSPYVELMQYTGLKDKEGRDIYEGDIVQKILNDSMDSSEITDLRQWSEENKVLFHIVHGDGWMTYSYLGQKGIVSMEVFRFWLKGEDFGYEGEHLQEPDDYVVIGNIYEHPHLLQPNREEQ